LVALAACTEALPTGADFLPADAILAVDGSGLEDADAAAVPELDVAEQADAIDAQDVAPDAAVDLTEDVTVDAAPDSGPEPCPRAGCDDGEPCTQDGCDGVGGCTHLPTAATCTDGDVCTEGDACADGKCAAGKAKVCADDGSPCTAESCDPGVGCVALAAAGPCTDGDVCTEGDACAGGKCAGGKGKVCADDGNPCTAESCDPGVGCVALAAAGTCTDGDVCTEGDGCADGKCAGGKAKVCADDGSPCTAESCDKAKGCVALAAAGACSDGDVCTEGDACAGGKCAEGKAKVCADDGNPCTAESCDPGVGCVALAAAGPCTDGDVCTEGDACADGKCLGKAKVCNDGNPCTDDACDKLKGCTTPAKADGAVCGTGAACAAGVCAPTCTSGQACNDGNACTSGDSCKSGTCTGAAVVCDDKNACTNDSCDPAKGCVVAFTTAVCDDGSACTASDACSTGECGGQAKSCEDGSACTTDTCAAASGCQNAAVNCDDGNACTVDSCDKAKGCQKVAGQDGTACGGSATCKAGICTGSGTCTDADLWQKTFGGAGIDEGHAIADAGDGGYAVAGSTNSKGTGEDDFWLIRTDGAGKLLWDSTYGTAASDVADAVTRTNDGGFVLAGWSWGTGKGLDDGWVVRTDKLGKQVWAKAYGGAGNDVLHAVVAVAGGDFLVAGGTTTGSAGGKDAWLLRLDAAGSLIWEKRVGGSKDDELFGAAVLAGGDLLFAGRTMSGGAGKADGWVVRRDSAGTAVFDFQVGGMGDDGFLGIAPLPDGGAVSVGSTASSGAGGSDGWAVRFAKDGSQAWARTYGGAGGDELRAVATLDADHLQFVGTSGTTPGAPDAWLVSVDGSGIQQWQKTYGGADAETGADLVMAPSGVQALVGVGDVVAKGGTGTLVRRVDSWGHATCQQGGVCASMTWNACTDGNICTSDLCTGAKGCTYAASDGTACSQYACFIGGQCENNACYLGGNAPTKFFLTSLKSTDSGDGASHIFSPMARLGSDYVLAGRTTWNFPKVKIVVMRSNQAGKLVWSTDVDNQLGLLPADICVANPVQIVIPAQETAENGDVRTVAYQLSSTGGLTGKQYLVAMTGQVSIPIRALVRDSMCVVWGISSAVGGKAASTWYVQVPATGKASPASIVPLPSEYIVHDVAAVGKGFVLAGGFSGGQPSGVFIGTVNENGAVGWFKPIDTPLQLSEPSLIDRPDGSLLMAAVLKVDAPNYNNRQSILLFLTKEGLLSKTVPLTLGTTGRLSIANLPDSAVALLENQGHNKKLPSPLLTFVSNVDGAWAPVVQKGYFEGVQQVLHGGLLVSQTGITFTAVGAPGGGNSQWYQASTDFFGNTQCGSGACVNKTTSACLDDNTCTTDDCNIQIGCSHTANKQPCTDNTPCTHTDTCTAGACKGTPSPAPSCAMTTLPASTTTQGCNPTVDTACATDESPAHPTTLAAFALDTKEVSNLQYAACVSSGKCATPAATSSACTYGKSGKDAFPVNCVTYDQAVAYCKWAYGDGRLPTEAEWERAARSTDARKYPWGNTEPDTTLANFLTAATKAVASYAAGKSADGLFDLAGNVREWVADWYDAGAYATAPASNPTGPGSGVARVVRGGGYNGDATAIRAGARSSADPANSSPSLGFRCARSGN